MGQTKCIKVHSRPLPDDDWEAVSGLAGKYSCCRDYFYARFAGIGSMDKIQSFIALRNGIRKENRECLAKGRKSLEDRFGFQNRHWVMSLFTCTANIKTQWENVSMDIRDSLKHSSSLSAGEKSYIRYAVSVPSIWADILNRRDVTKPPKAYLELKGALKPGRLETVHNYICRQTRKHKPAIPRSGAGRTIDLDQEMYDIVDREDGTYLSMTSADRGKRINIKLRSPYTYDRKGNITIALDHGTHTVTIHKAIATRTKQADGKDVLGIDKGVATLLSCSDGREYGQDHGRLLEMESERLNTANKGRNRMYARRKQLLKEAHNITVCMKQADGDDAYRELLKQKCRIQAKAGRIETCNLGKRTYNKKHNRAREELRKETNTAIKAMFRDSRPTLVVKEDLTFSTGVPPFSKKVNRKLSGWAKGYLDERLKFISGYFSVKTVDVNPAYTSQYCNGCGSPVKRKGAHREIAACPVCGDINANINAARNIKARYTDPEITLYTPYKTVKEILESRRRKADTAKAVFPA